MTAGAPVTITEPLRKLHQARRRSFVQSVSPLQPPPHKHLYRLLNSPSTAANFVAVSFVPQCFFLQYALPYMKTPYFNLNTAYDVFQFHNKVQIATLQEFRRYMLETLRPFYMNSTRGGMFINSCFAHCQSESQDTWLAPDSPRVHNKVCLCELNIRLLEHSSSKSFVSATFILLGKASQKLLVIGTKAEV